jgi:hypothetical protein
MPHLFQEWKEAHSKANNPDSIIDRCHHGQSSLLISKFLLGLPRPDHAKVFTVRNKPHRIVGEPSHWIMKLDGVMA